MGPSRNEIVTGSRRMMNNASANVLANSGNQIMNQNNAYEQPRVQGSRRMGSNRMMNTADSGGQNAHLQEIFNPGGPAAGSRAS